jgi:hypothetical protein
MSPGPDMRRLRCPACHAWGHTLADCRDTKGAPLETPSHNGPWQGSVAVRTVPTGVSGEDTGATRISRMKAQKGHATQSRLSAQRKLAQANLASRMARRKK